jgi:O-antigen/teichoic acid export membrane protein
MFSTASLRDLGGFGGNVFGTRVLFAVSRNADNILIGRFLGPGALGIYSLAYNLMLVPFERIAGPLQEVLFPAFSRLQDQRARIGELWLKANRLVAAVTLPATLGLIVLAPEFVDVVLGAKWAPAVPVIRILGWVGFLQSLVRLNSSILEACDRTNLLLRWSILISVANVCAFVGGLHWGVVGVAAGYAITNTALQPVNVWMTGRPVGVSLRSFVLNLAGVVQASVLMALVVLASRELLMAAGASPLLRLCVLPLVGAGIYLPLAAWRAPATFRDLRNLRSGRVAAAPAATMP